MHAPGPDDPGRPLESLVGVIARLANTSTGEGLAFGTPATVILADFRSSPYRYRLLITLVCRRQERDDDVRRYQYR